MQFFLRCLIYTCLLATDIAHSQTIDELEAELSTIVEGTPLKEELKETNHIAANYGNSVVLLGLNKITARSESLKAHIGEMIKFGKLEIIVNACCYAPDDEAPESKVLLTIFEHKSKEQKPVIFNGWMLASSPAISTLEHPVYDISVVKCMKE